MFEGISLNSSKLFTAGPFLWSPSNHHCVCVLQKTVSTKQVPNSSNQRWGPGAASSTLVSVSASRPWSSTLRGWGWGGGGSDESIADPRQRPTQSPVARPRVPAGRGPEAGRRAARTARPGVGPALTRRAPVPSPPQPSWTAAARRPCAASRWFRCYRCSSPCSWPRGPPRLRSARRRAWCGGPGCGRASFCPSAISTCRPSTRRAKTSLARPQVAFGRGPPLLSCPLPSVPAARSRRDRASRESARHRRGVLPPSPVASSSLPVPWTRRREAVATRVC